MPSTIAGSKNSVQVGAAAPSRGAETRGHPRDRRRRPVRDVGEGADARLVDELPEQVLGRALPRQLPADLHLATTEVVDREDHDEAVRALIEQVLPQGAARHGSGLLQDDPWTMLVEGPPPQLAVGEVPEAEGGVVEDDDVGIGKLVGQVLPLSREPTRRYGHGPPRGTRPSARPSPAPCRRHRAGSATRRSSCG